MQLPDEAPKLPKLPFLIGDGLLLGTAILIAQRSEAPLSGPALLAIVACVGLGAALAVVPFLAEFARRQEAALTERQNSLEALARTTAAAAEQISIAASGLHTIAELAHKNLKQAEQLPQRLQEKINEFSRQRDEAVVAENEALSQEVNSLRASEAEKLEGAATRIQRTVADLAKWEQILQTQVSAVREAAERLPAAADDAGLRAGRAIATASEDGIATMLAEIDARLAAALGAFTAQTSHLDLSSTETASSSRPKPKSAKAAAVETAPALAPVVNPASTAPAGESTTHIEPAPSREPEAAPALAAPDVAPSPPAAPASPVPPTIEVSPPAPAASRKRSRKAAEADQEILLDLGTFEGDNTSASGVTDRSLSNDGLTRLVVTAYIGIGNRLFVRGDGPGLSWDKGVPLQFVSIGKWRWETADASAPVSVKVLKNDQIECPALGAVTLEPGQQAEVNASF